MTMVLYRRSGGGAELEPSWVGQLEPPWGGIGA